MKRPIVTDPEKFGGEPFIEGTLITIGEVQAFWRQPGVGAVEARKRFPELSESELGAAVTYSPPIEPDFSFVAETEGTSRRLLRIWSAPPGWMFYVGEMDSEGVEQPLFDTWEETWDRILLYPEHYASKQILWRDEQSGEVVDIYSVVPNASRDD